VLRMPVAVQTKAVCPDSFVENVLDFIHAQIPSLRSGVPPNY
jgi:hypothetical protein